MSKFVFHDAIAHLSPVEIVGADLKEAFEAASAQSTNLDLNLFLEDVKAALVFIDLQQAQQVSALFDHCYEKRQLGFGVLKLENLRVMHVQVSVGLLERRYQVPVQNA